MTEPWTTKRLGDVCDLQNGFAFKSELFKPEGIPVLRISSIQDEQVCDNRPVFVDPSDYSESLQKYLVNEGDLLIAMSGATTGKVGFNRTGRKFLLNQRVGKFQPRSSLDINYLFYFLSTKVEENLEISAGSAQPNLSTKQINDFLIPLPQLPEQKRIVAILDEAFVGIAAATANSEKNLANTCELFDKCLEAAFLDSGDGWIESRFGDCFRLRSGDGLTSKGMLDGPYPVFGGNGIAGTHSEFNLSGNNVIIGRVGALCGNVRNIKEDIWLTDNAFKIVDYRHEFDNAFLTYLLNSKDLRSYARQTAQPVISNSSLKNAPLRFPRSLADQQSIAVRLDALSDKIEQLKSVVQRKISTLAELKQSILQRAFSSELVALPEAALQEEAA